MSGEFEHRMVFDIKKVLFFFAPLEKSSYLLEMGTIEMIWSLGVCLKFLYSVKMGRGDSVCWSLLTLGDELSTWGSLDCLPCFGMRLKTSINKLFFKNSK